MVIESSRGTFPVALGITTREDSPYVACRGLISHVLHGLELSLDGDHRRMCDTYTSALRKRCILKFLQGGQIQFNGDFDLEGHFDEYDPDVAIQFLHSHLDEQAYEALCVQGERAQPRVGRIVVGQQNPAWVRRGDIFIQGTADTPYDVAHEQVAAALSRILPDKQFLRKTHKQP